MHKDNVVAKIIFWIGVFEMIAGVVYGIIVAQTSSNDGFSLLFTWNRAIIIGMLFIGFAEVIELLHQLRENSDRKLEHVNGNEKSHWGVSKNIQNKINNFYYNQDHYPTEYYKTPFANHYYVKLNNNEFRMLVVERFGVKEELPKRVWSEAMVKWVDENYPTLP
ncbi:hypothetical protein [Bacillus kwashiorkori]|uniref:hypothetical protein n=1 Tax=Bacillus kwashiorkori TaxID=1522318 RepID=UPI00078144C7|nr:hypothetical protein [Bacillus kwashiorkori]